MRERPVYLNLFTFAFPITAIVSILHRASGFLLVLVIPLLLCLLQNSLFNYHFLEKARYFIIDTPSVRFIIWVSSSALIFHLFAGIRHLLMDAGWGETKTTARISSYVVLAAAIFCSLYFGYKLW